MKAQRSPCSWRQPWRSAEELARSSGAFIVAGASHPVGEHTCWELSLHWWRLLAFFEIDLYLAALNRMWGWIRFFSSVVWTVFEPPIIVKFMHFLYKGISNRGVKNLKYKSWCFDSFMQIMNKMKLLFWRDKKLYRMDRMLLTCRETSSTALTAALIRQNEDKKAKKKIPHHIVVVFSARFLFYIFGSNMMKQLDSESVKSLTLIHSHSKLHNTATAWNTTIKTNRKPLHQNAGNK